MFLKTTLTFRLHRSHSMRSKMCYTQQHSQEVHHLQHNKLAQRLRRVYKMKFVFIWALTITWNFYVDMYVVISKMFRKFVTIIPSFKTTTLSGPVAAQTIDAKNVTASMLQFVKKGILVRELMILNEIL